VLVHALELECRGITDPLDVDHLVSLEDWVAPRFDTSPPTCSHGRAQPGYPSCMPARDPNPRRPEDVEEPDSDDEAGRPPGVGVVDPGPEDPPEPNEPA
jgi:hypothetical protein